MQRKKSAQSKSNIVLKMEVKSPIAHLKIFARFLSVKKEKMEYFSTENRASVSVFFPSHTNISLEILEVAKGRRVYLWFCLLLDLLVSLTCSTTLNSKWIHLTSLQDRIGLV